MNLNNQNTFQNYLCTAVVWVLVSLSIFGSSQLGYAVVTANGTGTARTTALATIAITPVGGTTLLDFGAATANDPLKVVAPADTKAASFTVTGAPSTLINITLPGSISMVGPGGATIAVTTIVSTPAAPTTTLPIGGSIVLRVGGTRAAIPAAPTLGVYNGTFTVTVFY